MDIPISFGEAVDRKTILDIKSKRVISPSKLEKIRAELKTLEKLDATKFAKHYDALYSINSTLWCVEDELRLKEIAREFDDEFVSLARSVYKLNDSRFEAKNAINELASGNISEQKQHADKRRLPKLFVLPHLGLGDILCCVGLVRACAESYDVTLASKTRYKKHVDFLFRDLPNVNMIYKDDEREMEFFGVATTFMENNDNILMLGHFGTGRILTDPNFPAIFYHQAGMSRTVGWDNFFYVRDRFEEDALYEQTVREIKTDKYVVVHDDPSRGFYVETISEDCVRVYVGRDARYDLFACRKLLENAVAFHGFDSAFMWMIGLLRIPIKKYVHLAPRNTDPKAIEYYFGKEEAEKWIVV